jgi:hypothetical protein
MPGAGIERARAAAAATLPKPIAGVARFKAEAGVTVRGAPKAAMRKIPDDEKRKRADERMVTAFQRRALF